MMSNELSLYIIEAICAEQVFKLFTYKLCNKNERLTEVLKNTIDKNDSGKYVFAMSLSENVHLLRYTHPSSLQRTHKYTSFLKIRVPCIQTFFNSLHTSGIPTGS